MVKKDNLIEPENLQDKLGEDPDFILMDVREPEEFEICHIDGSILVPYSEFSDHISDFNTNDEYVIVCKKGEKSQKVLEIMQDQGFDNLKMLDGGIMKWADSVEKTMEKY